jgi:hypothetical protein
MRRRELILVVGSMMTAARPLRGQQKAVPVIGFLGSPTPGSATPLVAAFLHGLEEMGYIEGQTSRLNTAGQKVALSGSRHWQPISSAARST